jgi:hypothetical protein
MGKLDELREARAGLYFLASPQGDAGNPAAEIAAEGAEALSSALEIIKALAEYHNAYVDWRLQGKWQSEKDPEWVRRDAARERLVALGVEELIGYVR